MGIINGMFDTDLSGWLSTIGGQGNADVIWDNGRARLRVYKCSIATIQQTFVIGSRKMLSFDYMTTADIYSESVGWNLIVDGVVVIGEGIPTLMSGTLSGTINKDISMYEGKVTTIQFTIIHQIGMYWYCNFADHLNTYLWIDNVREIAICPIPTCNFVVV